MIAWTPSQRRAIEISGGNVVVSAAAGAGKTAVLTERCLRLVRSGAPIDSLLVITFTESAANELRAKIGEKLRAYDSDRSQLLFLGRSWISTIHAFCLRVLRENALQAGISPYARIQDADEANLAEREAAEALITDSLGDPAVRRLLDEYADGDVRSLVTLIRNLGRLLASVPEPAPWLLEKRRILRAGAFPEEEFLLHVESAVHDVCEEASGTAALLEAQLPAAEQYAGYLRSLEADLRRMLAEHRSYDSLADALREYQCARLPRLPKEAAPVKGIAQRLVREVRDALTKDIQGKLVTQTAEEYGRGEAAVSVLAPVLLQLVGRARFAAERERHARDCLSFGDLEHKAISLLAGRDPGSRDVVERLRQYFLEVLVDEFQDVNPVQDRLVSSVSRSEPGNLFIVGDLKQSIYRFRLAEPRIFAERIAAVRAGLPRHFVSLQDNFRSREELLGIVNGVFDYLMNDELDGIGFDDTAFIRAGRNEPAKDSTFGRPFVELHLARARAAGGEEENGLEVLDRAEGEARLVAQRLTRLRDEGFRLQGREFSWRDCAILFRAAKGRVEVFVRVLEEYGIPAIGPGGGDLFAWVELRDLLALLRVLDNPRQDIPLAAVMHSPFGGFTVEELAGLRDGVEARNEPFHQLVLDRLMPAGRPGAAIERFRERLGAWRRSLRDRPISEALWRIITETGYLAYLAARPLGAQRQANVLSLVERARQFSSFARQGLPRFVRFLEDLVERGGELGPSGLEDERRDAVTIQTIHASKGLEWPVVVVPDLGRRFNLGDVKENVIADREHGLGLRVADLTRGIRYPTARYILLRARKRRELLAEELRLLYVAFTRARERLLLVGSGEPDLLRLHFHQPDRTGRRRLSSSALQRASNPLAWICRALGRLPPEKVSIDAEKARAVCAVTFHESVPAGVKRGRRGPATAETFDAATDPVLAPVARALTHRYAWEEETEKRAVFTVTELKTGALPEPEDQSRFQAGHEIDVPLPRFLRTGAGVDARLRGSVIHRFLQHVDLQATDMAVEFDRLVDRRVFQPEDRELIDFDGITWFFASDLGMRVRRRPGAVRREVPFVARLGEARAPVLVRGVVDGVIVEEEGLEIFDFKTDRVSQADVAKRAEFYRPQIVAYRWALGGIWKLPVAAAHLVFLTPRMIVPVSEADGPPMEL